MKLKQCCQIDTVLTLLESYLNNRLPCVDQYMTHLSVQNDMRSAPRLHSRASYVQHLHAPTSSDCEKQLNIYHNYAVTYIYIISPSDSGPIQSLSSYIEQISWMCQNFLQLNNDKSEMIVWNKIRVICIAAVYHHI